MGISHTSTAAAEQTDRRTGAGHVVERSLLVRVGDILRRGFEPVCIAIFDDEGDCMRF